MTVSDAQLIGRLANDPTGEGLRTLYRRYAGELYGFALNSLNDRGLAEEVVQDAFTSVWRHADRFDPEIGSFRTWLYGLARNRIVDMRRRASVRPAVAAGEEVEERGEVDRSLDEAMLRWQIASALTRLSPDHREVIRMAHFQALTMREIAAALGLPLGTVKSRSYYALRHLRLVLDEMEVGR
ncbi:MAG: sigma-70 family RNA polymerase sigma factor [Thermoleophilaceae bacterium]|nr:sigma-70 family RNA polymerase sigma factor [Thermoleophilaceae bacterium]